MTTENKQNVVSLEDFLKPETNNVKYDTVEAHGTLVRVGSVSSGDMLEWIEGNGDESKKKRAGLRLLAKSIVDAEGKRYPADKHEDVVAALEQKDAIDNGKVLRKVLVLNGFAKAVDPTKDGDTESPGDVRKND